MNQVNTIISGCHVRGSQAATVSSNVPGKSALRFLAEHEINGVFQPRRGLHWWQSPHSRHCRICFDMFWFDLLSDGLKIKVMVYFNQLGLLEWPTGWWSWKWPASVPICGWPEKWLDSYPLQSNLGDLSYIPIFNDWLLLVSPMEHVHPSRNGIPNMLGSGIIARLTIPFMGIHPLLIFYGNIEYLVGGLNPSEKY